MNYLKIVLLVLLTFGLIYGLNKTQDYYNNCIKEKKFYTGELRYLKDTCNKDIEITNTSSGDIIIEFYNEDLTSSVGYKKLKPEEKLLIEQDSYIYAYFLPAVKNEIGTITMQYV